MFTPFAVSNQTPVPGFSSIAALDIRGKKKVRMHQADPSQAVQPGRKKQCIQCPGWKPHDALLVEDQHMAWLCAQCDAEWQ
jgi:hypothetical protein